MRERVLDDARNGIYGIEDKSTTLDTREAGWKRKGKGKGSGGKSASTTRKSCQHHSSQRPVSPSILDTCVPGLRTRTSRSRDAELGLDVAHLLGLDKRAYKLDFFVGSRPTCNLERTLALRLRSSEKLGSDSVCTVRSKAADQGE